jgi:hypothetical protein
MKTVITPVKFAANQSGGRQEWQDIVREDQV